MTTIETIRRHHLTVARLALALGLAQLALAFAAPVAASAAQAPLTEEELEQAATHVIRGTVTKIDSRVEKSTVEKSFLNRDTLFTITVRIEAVTKGEGLEVGKTVEVVAWKPKRRFPPLPGPQGHSNIPAKGDTVIVFVQLGSDGIHRVIHPNGFQDPDDEEPSPPPPPVPGGE